MAVTYGFFNSVNGDRKYNAEQMSEYFRGIINEGVYQHLDGGLAVTAGTGLAVNVAAGRAIIQNRWVQNSAAMSLTIAAASETYARKDAVVIRLNWSSRSISIAVKTGTPAASPVAPSMTRNSTTYEMALAYVNVAANATSVTVTDKRSDSTVCGWVTVAQATSGEVDAMLNAMKTGFDGVVYPSPAAMVQGCDQKLQDEIDVQSEKIIALQNNADQVISLKKSMITQNGYFTVSGQNVTINASVQHAIIRINDNSISKIIIDSSSSISFATVALMNDSDKVVYAPNTLAVGENTYDLSPYAYSYILINWWEGQLSTPSFFNSVTFSYKNDSYVKWDNVSGGFDIVSSPINSLFGKSATYRFDGLHNILNGYIDVSQGQGIGLTHHHVLFPAKSIKKLTVTPGTDTPALAYAILYPDDTLTNGSYLVNASGGSYTFEFPTDGYIGVNWFANGNYAASFTLEYFDISAYVGVSKGELFHIVNKPFDFSGKTAVYTGDSITYGFTSGSTTTQNNYPKLFSEKVGLTYTNGAQGGALFCSGYNEVTTIPNQVKAIATTPDFLFIAGGINDWQMGATLAELETTLIDLCQWINTNMSTTEVIWITPINQAGWDTTHQLDPKGSVDDFRKKITTVVERYNTNGKYSVVQGKLFNFPVRGDDSAYITAMFGDLLHPTELGYKALYTRGLLTALC